MKLRDEVKWFAEKMETELLENDNKGGWRDCWIEDMLARIPEEYKELLEAVASKDAHRVISEAADVANFALMVADIANRYGVQLGDAAEQSVQPKADESSLPSVVNVENELPF